MNTYVIDAIIIFLLLIVNGALAMTEIALVSSNRNKMGNMAKKNEGAKIAAKLMDNPGSFLSTIQIGITIIGIISGAFSGQHFAEPLGIWLSTVPGFAEYGNLIAFTFVIFVITYVSLVIGELIPKRIGLTQPEKIATLFSKPIHFLSKLAYPFVFILDVSTKFLLKLMGQKEVKDSVVTEEEIHSIIKQGLDEGAIDAFEHKIFHKILQFGDKDASIMMTPRIKLTYLDLEDSDEENKKKILTNPHRYYPIFEGGLDNFKGIVDTKSVLSQVMEGQGFNLRPLIKDAPCVLAENVGQDLLEEFVKYRTHIAIVVDEYGSIEGIITLVDIFETLIGHLPESQQTKHYEITQREDGSWLSDGLTPIDEIEELLGVSILNEFEEENFNTLAGFLLIHFKHIPKAGEKLEWNQFKFEIMDMDGTRIDKILIERLKNIA